MCSLVSRAGDDYQAMITRSPAGDGQSVTFGKLFTDLELENFVLKVGRFRSRTEARRQLRWVLRRIK